MARAVHYIGFRGDEFTSAYRLFGGPVVIHRVHDQRAQRDIGEDDLVIFANKETEEIIRPLNAPDVVGYGYTPDGKERTD